MQKLFFIKKIVWNALPCPPQESCCGYGPDGTGARGYDCLEIPGAKTVNNNDLTPNVQRFCMRNAGLATGTTDAREEKTICSKEGRGQGGTKQFVVLLCCVKIKVSITRFCSTLA